MARRLFLLAIMILLFAWALWGCKGPKGDTGPRGAAGTTGTTGQSGMSRTQEYSGTATSANFSITTGISFKSGSTYFIVQSFFALSTSPNEFVPMGGTENATGRFSAIDFDNHKVFFYNMTPGDIYKIIVGVPVTTAPTFADRLLGN